MTGWLWLSALVVVLDQATKWLAEGALVPYTPAPLIPSLNLTLMYNEGAAFSFLADAGGWQRWFFAALAAVVTVVLTLWLRRLKAGEGMTAIGLVLVIGGAIGNVIDRVLIALDEKEAIRLANEQSGRKLPAVSVIEKLPPVVTILSPADRTEVFTPSATIRYTVRSQEPITLL